jgi:hypothetical protein
MANDNIIQSPEYNNCGRREGLAVGATILTGTFCKYVSGGVSNSDASPLLGAGGLVPKMIATSNIANASDIEYVYGIGENVFLQSVPSGCLVNAKAVAATYLAGALLAVTAAGTVQAAGTEEPFATVPSFGGAVVSAGGSLIIELL